MLMSPNIRLIDILFFLLSISLDDAIEISTEQQDSLVEMHEASFILHIMQCGVYTAASRMQPVWYSNANVFVLYSIWDAAIYFNFVHISWKFIQSLYNSCRIYTTPKLYLSWAHHSPWQHAKRRRATHTHTFEVDVCLAAFEITTN